MFLAAPSSRLLAAVLSGLLLAASAHPLQHYYFPAGENNLVARQLATSTADVSSTPRAISSSTLSQSQATTHSRPTSISPSTTPISSRSVAVTSTLLATSPLAPETPITSTHISTFSRTSTSTSPTSPSSTATTAMTTSTSRPNNIFSKNSPYYFYAIAVSVVVGIFGFLLLVLLVRFVVQRFTKRPRPEPITTNLGAGAWRYSEDSDADSARRLPSSANTTETRPNMRHKDLHAEMGERRAFLSTEDVALYAPGSLSKTESRYNDDEPEYPTRVRSFSGSSGSQTTTTPFVSRRPGSMSFLHSPMDTRPALVVHPGSEPGHTEEAQQLRRAPEDSAGMPDPASSLLLTRATYSDPYRQQTLASGVTDLSRTASTASAYSQLSADLSPPPVPALPAQYAKPTPPQLSPDVSAALASMRVQGASMDSISSNAINTTAPPTEEGTAPPSAAVPRPRPGRAGWSGRTPSSIHGPDLYFGN